MNLNAIPFELKARKQWVVWRSVIRTNQDSGETSVTKPPFNPANPQYEASVIDPNTWGTFEQATVAFQENPSLLSGIGFVFTAEDEYFGIDIDDEAKVQPQHLQQRRELVEEILMNTTSYAELSPSGKGIHIIGKGRLPTAGTRSTAVQVECYAAMRYFTMTGDVINGRAAIVDEQKIADRFFSNFRPAPVSMQVDDTNVNRRLDLSDDEVIRLAANFHPNFAPRFNAQADCEPGRWSDSFMMVVGFVERFTGSVEQVQRIVFNSPLVLNAPPAANGESRLEKAKRNFSYVLARTRQNNSGLLAFSEHGRQIVEQMERIKEERAREAAKEILAKAEETLSKSGADVLKAFPLDPRHLTLTAPPGVAGDYCRATAAACYNPFLKFSIPATLATLAGILGRSYKLPNGKGLNLNFILAAATASGKTQTMDAWEGFLDRASKAIGNSVQGQSFKRLLRQSTSSLQGIFPDFMAQPSAVWFISECASQLRQMSDPKTTTDNQLRDAYNDLYDCSSMGKFFQPPRSVANKKADMEPIENLAISTYWTTTTSKFDVFNDDAQDGFLSRVVIIRHAGSAGEAIPEWDVQFELAPELNAYLVARLAAAKKFDETHDLSPHEAQNMLTMISTAEVSGMAWAFRQISERIKNASLNGDLPVAYTAVSRLPVTAARLAGVLAVMDNPFAPSITEEQYKWAFGYLLQNLTALLSDMDRGELGASMSKDMDVVVREMKRTMRKNNAVGVKRAELVHALRYLKPFSADHNPGDAIRRTISDMLTNGHIAETIMTPQGAKGRPSTWLHPTDDAIWQ
jgi:hypothetical protein